MCYCQGLSDCFCSWCTHWSEHAQVGSHETQKGRSKLANIIVVYCFGKHLPTNDAAWCQGVVLYTKCPRMLWYGITNTLLLLRNNSNTFTWEDICLELSCNSTTHTAMLICGRHSVFAVWTGQEVLYSDTFSTVLSLCISTTHCWR